MTNSEVKLDVLVVDDNRAIDEYLENFYSPLGHRVMMATRADKAIRYAEENRGRPTLALVDIDLPGPMDGLALISHLTQYAPHVACYVITGNGDEELHRRLKWEGAIDVFVKPLRDDDLLRAVEGPLVQRLTKQELNDFLTQLQTRRVFEDVAEGKFSATKRIKERLSLLFIDVDEFKEINDEHGHDVGDEALRSVAVSIRQHLRSYDHPCRWGGDEFAVLFTWISQKETMRRVKSLKSAVSGTELVTKEGKSVKLSISIGVAFLEEADTSFADMVRRADKAMYADKPGSPAKRADV